jgi:hypothetical protein
MATEKPQQLQLSAEEIQYYQFLKGQGILLDIDRERVDQSKGAVVVFCGDANKSGDIHSFHAELMRFWRGGLGPRAHLCARNGGALLIPNNSPIVRPGSTAGEDLLFEIQEALENLDIGVVFILADVPCLKVHKHALQPPQVLDLITSAKGEIKRRVPKAKVLACLRISWSSRIHKTYVVPRKAWADTIATRTIKAAWSNDRKPIEVRPQPA